MLVTGVTGRKTTFSLVLLLWGKELCTLESISVVWSCIHLLNYYSLPLLKGIECPDFEQINIISNISWTDKKVVFLILW